MNAVEPPVVRRAAKPRRGMASDRSGQPRVTAPALPERLDFGIELDGRRWQVQHWRQAGPGPGGPNAGRPPTVLLHGTGASTHSWRHLAPLLAQQGEVLALDLPGHGRSDPAPPGRATLPAVAAALWPVLDRLCDDPGRARWRLVGHSAGGAVAVQMALLRPASVTGVHGLNAALLPFRGVMGEIAPRMARFLARQTLVPHLVAFGALDPSVVPMLLAGTGSRIDAEGQAAYRRLATQPRHVAGTLALMAGWDLEALERALPGLTVPLRLLAAERDRTVSPMLAHDVARRVPGTQVHLLPLAGHLAHEEPLQAGAVAAWLND